MNLSRNVKLLLSFAYDSMSNSITIASYFRLHTCVLIIWKYQYTPIYKDKCSYFPSSLFSHSSIMYAGLIPDTVICLGLIGIEYPAVTTVTYQ